MAEDALAPFGIRHAVADFDDLASDVAAEDHWLGFDKVPCLLHLPVHRVDGDGRILDYDLAGFDGWVGGCVDVDAGALCGDPSCLVGHVWLCHLVGLNGRAELRLERQSLHALWEFGII